jgi:predicted transcriptional regulator
MEYAKHRWTNSVAGARIKIMVVEGNIGKDLAFRRMTWGLRQWRVAQEAGICATVLSEIENGRRMPSPEVVAKVRAAIDRLSEGVR